MKAAHGVAAATTAGTAHLALNGISIKAETAVGASIALTITMKYGNKRRKKAEWRAEMPASAVNKVRACLGRPLTSEEEADVRRIFAFQSI